MRTVGRTFNGHDFTFGVCVCGLTHREYDDRGQPPCVGSRASEPGQLGPSEKLAREAVASVRRAIAARPLQSR